MHAPPRGDFYCERHAKVDRVNTPQTSPPPLSLMPYNPHSFLTFRRLTPAVAVQDEDERPLPQLMSRCYATPLQTPAQLATQRARTPCADATHNHTSPSFSPSQVVTADIKMSCPVDQGTVQKETMQTMKSTTKCNK